MAVVAALAFSVLAPGAATSAFADTTAPASSKTLVDNGDGTYDLSLSVTGSSQSSQSSSKADVVVVLDLSGSMSYRQGSSTRLAIAKSAVNQLASELLSNNTTANPDSVTLSLVTFSDYATARITQTTNLADFQRTVNGLRAEGGTNWEDALQTANGISTRDGADVYVIFVSDGDPTYRNTRGTIFSMGSEDARHTSNGHVYYGSGNSDDNGRNYRYASQQAEAIDDAGKTLYSIGVFGNVSNMKQLASDAGQSDNYYNVTDQQGLTEAFDDIVNQITNNVSYTDVSITDGLTSLTATTLVAGEADGFTYSKTENGTTAPWTDAPAASYDGSSVSWDLSSLGSLENNVTYTVTFTVHPSQTAIDVIAQLENGTLTLEQANLMYDGQFAQTADGGYGLKTNTSATVDYTQTHTTTTSMLPDDAKYQSDGTWYSASTGLTYTYDSGTDRYVATTSTSGAAAMDEPDPLPVSTPTVGVAKTWIDTLDESVRPTGDISFDVMLDGATKLATVTLNAVNGYRADVHVPYGITADGVDLTSGHKVTLGETNLDDHYEFATETVRPMLVDGTLVLGGDGDSALTGSNTLKSRIAITKQAEGSSYPADASFGYDITVNAPDGAATLPYTVYAADGTTVASTGSLASGVSTTVSIGVGQKIVIDEVPVGTAYSVTEASSPAGWNLVSAGDTGGQSEVSGSTVAGTIARGNTQNDITYTNRFTPAYSSPTGEGNLTVSKQLDGRDLAAGQFSFTLAAATEGAPLPDDTTVENDADGAVLFGTIQFDKVGTYRYTLSEEQGTASGYTYDGASYTLVAEVTPDSATGALEVAWSVEGSTARTVTFQNSYSASGTADITATKTLTGRAMSEGEFSFAVVDGAGNTVANATSPAAEDGQAATIDFGTFSYSTAQIAADVARGAAVKNADGSWTYTYSAREDVSDLPGGVTATASSFSFTVTIVDNGDGTLTVTPTYPRTSSASTAAGLAFANEYGTDAVQLGLIGSKNLVVFEGLNGPGDIAGAYTFTLSADTTGAPMPGVATATNDKSGTVAFGSITFDQAGTYVYRVTESGSVDGVANDPSATSGKTVTVKVTDDGEGHLSAAVVDASGVPVAGAAFTFTNSYSVQSTTATVSVAKNLVVPEGLTGPGDIAGEYTFALSADTAGAPLPERTQVTNPDGDGGAASFGSITFTAPGTYVYRVTESGSVDGVANDPSATSGKTVTIRVADNGAGALVASAVDALTFTNTYDAKAVALDGSSSLAVTKVVSGHDSPAGFSFTLTPTFTVDGSGVVIPAGAETAQTGAMADGAQTTLTFGALTFTKPGTFGFTIAEDGTDGDGWTCDERVHEVTVSVVDNGKGQLVATVAGNNPTVTNTYAAESVTLSGDTALAVTKAVSGNDSSSGFSFTLAPRFTLDGSGVTIVAGGDTAQTGAMADGAQTTLTFGDVTFSKAGEYAFSITEDGVDADGWTCDKRTHRVVVVVTDNGKGRLVATVTGNNPTITNTYRAEGVTLEGDAALSVNKTVVGHDSVEEYSFTLTPDFTLAGSGVSYEGGANVARTTGIIGDGETENAIFGAVTFTKAGTFSFEVKETAGTAPGWEYSNAVATITVTVKDDGKGQLVASVSGNGPTFTNTYEAEDVTLSGDTALAVTKAVSGYEGTEAYTFSLALVSGDASGVSIAAGGDTASTVGIIADGSSQTVSFGDVTFSKVGTYTFETTEQAGAKAGWTYDSGTHEITVVVTDGGAGKLVADVTGNNPTFTNTYKAAATDPVTLTATKKLSGTTLMAGQFSFELRDEDGGLVGSASNDGNGLVSFGALTFAAPGTYVYTMSEVNQHQDGITYDDSTYNVVVTVTDDGSGKLKAAVTGDNPTFNNAYSSSSTSALVLTAQKVLEGRVLADGQFSFQLYDEQGAPIGSTVTNNAAGSVSFAGITYTQDDFAGVEPASDGSRTKQFVYTAKEVADQQPGYTYASNTATYTVMAVDRGGAITATVESAQNTTFTNTYTASPVTAAPFTAVKTLEGRTATAGEFSFQLVDEAGDVVQTATNAADGSVTFSPITYELSDLGSASSKTFTYTMSEVKNGVGGITYDTASHTASVTVTDNGDGTLSVSDPVYDTQQAPTFANTYAVTPEAVALPTAAKTVSGDDSDAYPTFSFTIEALDGAPAPDGADSTTLTRTLQGPGTVSFGSVVFAEEGTYRYRVSEIAGDASGWTYDASTFTVTYTVTDAGDGTFDVERTIVDDASGATVDAIVFQNGYTAPAVPSDPGTPDEPRTTTAATPVTTPATGDGLPIAPIAALAGAAGAAVAVGAVKRRQAQAHSASGRGAHQR